MKVPWHFLGRFFARITAFILAALYLLSPAALIFAAAPKPTCQITVNPTSISIGGSVTVRWTSANATAGAITNVGNVGPTGSINLLPSSAAITTYFGAFTGPGGTTNCQASVAVNSGSTGGGTIDGTPVTNIPVATTGATPTATPAPTGVSSGLVPCGYGTFTGGNESSSSTGCQACNLAQLIQNIITFAIGMAIPIAAALFAYAGFLYITSATNPGNIGKAKGIFKDALIGFLIAITAWIVINTLLHVIFTGSSPFAGGNWFTIQCDSVNRPVNNKITNVLANLPIVAGNTGQIQPDSNGGGGNGGTGSGVSANGSPSGSGTSCPANAYFSSASNSCVDITTGETASAPSGSNSYVCPANAYYSQAASGCVDVTTGEFAGNSQTSTNNQPSVVATQNCSEADGCTVAQANAAIAAYNASAGANQLTSNSGVSYDGIDRDLLQSLISNAGAAGSGAVNVTSCDDGTHADTSNHYAGDACDVTYRNQQFNNYIATLPKATQNFVAPGQPAYVDSNGMVWSYEPAASNANTSGAHWHVSVNGH